MADEDEQITADIGGVQGAADDETDDQVAEAVPPAPELGGKPDQPAPDAGEIEWSGGLIKKPPSPTA